MINRDIIDEAYQWSQEFQQRAKTRVSEIEDDIANGLVFDEEKYEDYKTYANMSIEDIKRNRLQQLGLNNHKEIGDDEFVESSTKIGLSPTSAEALSLVIGKREAEYIRHYQVDKDDPGMMFIVNQIIQDELQVKRLRQDLVIMDVTTTKQSDKDDAQKRIIDSINKINKTVFDFTKYLQVWRDEKVKLVELKKEKEESRKKTGIEFNDFKEKMIGHVGVIQAKEAQKKKKSEYMEMVESSDE
jgi:hypothetical protein